MLGKLLSQSDDLLRGRAGMAGLEDREAASTHSVGRLVGMVAIFGFLYGAVMGGFGGITSERSLQIAYSGIKAPLLLLATFAISVPSFFVLNTLMGLRDDFGQSLRAVAASQAGLTIVLASLAPYTMLWYVSFADYQAAVLFNGAMFAVASFSAQWLLRRLYRHLIVRDARHRIMLRLWLVVYVFVGIQMAWVLRPFIGDPNAPTQFFRKDSWSNAYVVVAGLVWSLIQRVLASF